MNDYNNRNNPYGNGYPPPYPLPPQYSPYPPVVTHRPGSLIFGFILALIVNLPAAIIGFSAGTFISGIGIAAGGLFGDAAIAFGIVVAIISSITVVLWIFAFAGKNGARVTLLVFLWIDLIGSIIGLDVFFWQLLFLIIEIIILSSGSVKSYCMYRASLNRNAGYGMSNNLYQPRQMGNMQNYKSGTAFLNVENGINIGKQFPLNSSGIYIIGRAGNIRIPPSDRKASREHARINFENGRFVLYDLNSTNHTFVNGTRVQRKVLSNGDLIKVGDTAFRFIER